MVLSIAHMSMVIFPIIFYIFHMSGVKKKRKNQKKYLRAAPSVDSSKGLFLTTGFCRKVARVR